MHEQKRIRWKTWASIVVAAAVIVGTAAPITSQPNPYTTIERWGQLPEGRTWGSTSAVDVAPNGHIWVAERCGANTCAGSNLPPILEFDPSGKLLKTFGAGLMVFPHGFYVDTEGNVWVTDGQGKDGKGHQVFKFSPEGKLLLTLGKAGVAGAGPDEFNQPSDVVVAPNGDIFVAEGHASAAGANARILRFDKKGKYLGAWGSKGSDHVEFDQPHALAMDSRGRLFVGDRSNNRIQILDLQGNWLAEWSQFSRPSGIYIRNDTIYVTDSESGSVNPAHGAWKRGIRIGSAKDGAIWAFIPDPAENATNTSAAEGVAVDARGNIYGAEVGPRRLQRYVKP